MAARHARPKPGGHAARRPRGRRRPASPPYRPRRHAPIRPIQRFTSRRRNNQRRPPTRRRAGVTVICGLTPRVSRITAWKAVNRGAGPRTEVTPRRAAPRTVLPRGNRLPGQPASRRASRPLHVTRRLARPSFLAGSNPQESPARRAHPRAVGPVPHRGPAGRHAGPAAGGSPLRRRAAPPRSLESGTCLSRRRLLRNCLPSDAKTTISGRHCGSGRPIDCGLNCLLKVRNRRFRLTVNSYSVTGGAG